MRCDRCKHSEDNRKYWESCMEVYSWNQEDEGMLAVYEQLKDFTYVCHKMDSKGGKPKTDTMAYANDAESYIASVRVKPNFFCAMFDTKAE